MNEPIRVTSFADTHMDVIGTGKLSIFIGNLERPLEFLVVEKCIPSLGFQGCTRLHCELIAIATVSFKMDV